MGPVIDKLVAHGRQRRFQGVARDGWSLMSVVAESATGADRRGAELDAALKK